MENFFAEAARGSEREFGCAGLKPRPSGLAAQNGGACYEIRASALRLCYTPPNCRITCAEGEGDLWRSPTRTR